MSGWYAKAIRKEIRPGASDPAIKPVGVILHVAVSEAASLFTYFNGPSDGIESHFYIRRDGAVEQYRDAGHEADANFKANSFVEGGVRKGYLSVETQGGEQGKWTDAQLAAIKALILWAHETYDIPLRVPSGPKVSGVGYHTLFPSWSNVPGKTCPGPDRKAQFREVLVPWLAKAGAPKPTRPSVSLAAVVRAARHDPDAKEGTFTAKADVLLVEKALQGEGLLHGKQFADGHFGTLTLQAYSSWQRHLGFTGDGANGIPGKESLTKLGTKHGFAVAK